MVAIVREGAGDDLVADVMVHITLINLSMEKEAGHACGLVYAYCIRCSGASGATSKNTFF